MFATLPDALRLFVVPVFAWAAALQDVRTRRLPNRLWPAGCTRSGRYC